VPSGTETQFSYGHHIVNMPLPVSMSAVKEVWSGLAEFVNHFEDGNFDISFIIFVVIVNIEFQCYCYIPSYLAFESFALRSSEILSGAPYHLFI